MRHKQPEHPRQNANWISILFFSWLLPLFQKGFHRPLDIDDVYKILPGDESRYLGDLLENAWNNELDRQNLHPKYKPSLLKAIIIVFGPAYAALGVFPFYEECIIKILQPLCLGFLLQYFKNPSEQESFPGFGKFMAISVILLSVCYTSSDHPFTFACQHIGMKVRVAITSLMYRKVLRTSKVSVEQTSAGQVVNLLCSDMQRFDVLLTFLHYIWVAPLQLVITILILYFYMEIGLSCLAGIALMIIFVPIQGIMGKLFSRLRSATATKTDSRLRLTEDILSAMRVIKLYGWEELFIDEIQEAREGEVRCLRKTANCKAVNQSLFYVASRLTLFITLLVYVITGNRLTSEMVYVSLALYNAIQTVLTLFFPAAVGSLAETLVSIRRLKEFLLLPEYQKSSKDFSFDSISSKSSGDFIRPSNSSTLLVSENKLLAQLAELNGIQPQKKKLSASLIRIHQQNKSHIILKNGTAQWNPGSKEMVFSNVSLKLRSGKIIALVGPVGAGKGSLLHALLDELPLKSGSLRIKGTIGYSPQEPWIFSGSVRENILFGKEFDSVWYEQVVEACALARDFTLFPYGDHTLVGDRGSALSGGQKARITLARAVYADADLYLLDAPLAAVDAEVQQHLMEKCILGLLKNKGRILVTHQLQYLKYMDEIIVLVDGRVSFQGTYQQLISQEVVFADYFANFQKSGPTNLAGSSSHHLSSNRSITNFPMKYSSGRSSTTSLALGNTVMIAKSPVVPNVREYVCTRTGDSGPPLKKLDSRESGKPELLEETVKEGDLNWKVYWSYLSSGTSLISLLLLFFLLILTQTIFTFSDMWLQLWITLEKSNGTMTGNLLNITTNLGPYDNPSDSARLVYTMLIVGLFVVCTVRTLHFFAICMQTSVDLHERLFMGLIRSPMRLFEDNPLGRILNRFAKDMGLIDEALPVVAFDTLEILLQSLGVVAIVAYTSPIMLFPAFLMMALFYIVRKFFFYTSRSVKRLEGVARSPVFAHFSTTVYGLTTIRAFGTEEMVQSQFEEHLDVHSSTWYIFLAASRWLGIVVDWLAIVFVGCVVLNCFLTDKGDTEAGLTISSAMMLTSMLQWGMRQSAELSSHMISVERVLEYCDLPPEGEFESAPGRKPPDDWPSRGEIKIRNMYLKYSPDQNTFILKNINCTIHPGEKVGIVGRTGAGKSSLLSVIFRIVEPTEGFIEIDGIVTSMIGLHDLRSRISIIPQEPVLFQGTIRRNLDPFLEYSDADIWDVLKDVHLSEAVNELPRGLHDRIAERGNNFSVGQKQLFCLARAILRNNKILVMDEATANVDSETDALIQRTIRNNFAYCTVIIIAHRLHTVMDSDKIIVLDAGQILEFDEPDKLLQNTKSALHELVRNTGPAEATQLRQIAAATARKKRGFLVNS